MRGIVVINAYYSTPASEYQADRVAAELKLLGDTVEICTGAELWLRKGINCDYAVFFDKDINLARRLEQSGIRVFNSADGIAVADDKITTALVLERAGLPIPKTVPAPLRYGKGTDRGFLLKMADIVGYPMVIKPAFGSLGMDIKKADDFDALVAADYGLSDRARLYQECVISDLGRSVRVAIVGGEPVAAMRLTNDKDFRSNSAVGGRAEKFDGDSELFGLAVAAAEAFGLDYCGVDLFENAHKIIEVNSNAYFSALERTCGSNVAGAYARHIVKTTRA